MVSEARRRRSGLGQHYGCGGTIQTAYVNERREGRLRWVKVGYVCRRCLVSRPTLEDFPEGDHTDRAWLSEDDREQLRQEQAMRVDEELLSLLAAQMQRDLPGLTRAVLPDASSSELRRARGVFERWRAIHLATRSSLTEAS